MTWTDAELMFACEHCDMPAGIWCRTARGGRATLLHRSRYESVRRVIELTGYQEEVSEFYRLRREQRNAIRELHDSLTNDSYPSAWLRIRLSEILAVR